MKIWPIKQLNEICIKIKAGGTPSRRISSYWEGNIPFAKIEDIVRSNKYIEKTTERISEDGLKNSNAWLVPSDSVLFSIYASIGEVAISKKPLATNQAILGIVVKKEIIIPDFLFYYLKFIGKKLIMYNIQSTQKNLTLEIVKNIEIPLPPLEVQQKIVEILDTIQNAIELQDKITEKTKELKKSLMNDLFKYGAPSFRKNRKLKKTEIGEIPENWQVVRLGDQRLFEIKLGGTPKTMVDEYWNGDIDWITPDDLSRLTYPYIEKTQRKITKKGLEVGSTLLEGGSIILSTRAPIGYVAILKKAMAFNQGCKGILLKDQRKILNLFLYYYIMLNSRILNELGCGSTFRELSTNDLRNFPIPLPPLQEQKEIAEILQTVDKKIEIEKKKKELYEELFKTMLNKIMNGEVDVEKIVIP